MLKTVKSFINKWLPAELGEVKTPQNTNADFILTINHMEIGKLELHNGKWIFKYSEEFKNQDSFKPLINFPDKNKEYSSSHLWPFFASRIPGLGQPIVKDFLHKKGLEKADEVTLLKEFGKRTIANPYILEMGL
jgi:HipA-like protein